MKQTAYLITTLLLVAYGNSKNTQVIAQSNPNEISENQADYKNELVVHDNCVIFLWPDSTEIAQMQAENDEETYNEIIADLTWYPGVAREVLDSFNIKNISCDKEFLILRNSNNKETRLKRKEIEGDMILFNTEKEPIISNAIDFDKEKTLKYFGK
jgi:hypothetical protein